METDLSPLPFWTEDLPGIGGAIKTEPEDFEVEEIPAYPPSGEGDFLYLWIEKRGMSADYLFYQLSKRLDIPEQEIGAAGRKDRHAVTRQMVSVPVAAESRLKDVESEDLRLLAVHRHNNKLKPGHLNGNRFRILIRNVEADAGEKLQPILDRLRQKGMPNYYGHQRFGNQGETGRVGLGLLQGKTLAEVSPENKKKWKHPRQRKFVLSAGQSALFNLYLAQRLRNGLLREVLQGDVMGKWPRGGMFTAEDLEQERLRFEAREIVPMGPIYGRKTFPAKDEAARREQEILEQFSISPDIFHNFGKLLQGTRRHNLVYIDDLQAEATSNGILCTFALTAGSYATVLLRELMKIDLQAIPE